MPGDSVMRASASSWFGLCDLGFVSREFHSGRLRFVTGFTVGLPASPAIGGAFRHVEQCLSGGSGFSEFEDLLRGQGAEEVHDSGNHPGPASLMACAEAC